jgi:hypothetical protein
MIAATNLALLFRPGLIVWGGDRTPSGLPQRGQIFHPAKTFPPHEGQDCAPGNDLPVTGQKRAPAWWPSPQKGQEFCSMWQTHLSSFTQTYSTNLDLSLKSTNSSMLFLLIYLKLVVHRCYKISKQHCSGFHNTGKPSYCLEELHM